MLGTPPPWSIFMRGKWAHDFLTQRGLADAQVPA